MDMDSKKVFELIKECSYLNAYRLALTGGEPLLSENLFDYAEYAKKQGIPEVVLMTNGLLINKKNIDSLKIFDIVQLSIDVPPGEKPHLRQDYLNELLGTIKALKKKKIHVTLQATIHRSLLPFLERLDKFSRDNKIQIGFNRICPVGEAAKLNKEILTSQELREALKTITGLKAKNKLIRCSDPLLFLVDKGRMNYLESLTKKEICGGCIAGIAALYIDVHGDVFPCAFLRQAVSNVFKENLKSIWLKNKILEKLRKREEFYGKCGSCRYIAYCGGCRAASLRKTGSLFNSDPLCWIKKK
jgi:radical SAM protein with 4Fe4S-binding SPASM domain